MIISFVNQKAGVGKTTSAINIGSSLARRSHRPVLLDLDPRGSSVKWHAVEGNQAFDVIHQPTIMIPADVEILSSAYDFVIIDAPPAIDGITRKILAASSIAIIPVSPSSLDLWACTETLKMVREVQQAHPELEAKFLINCKIPGTHTGREIRQALKVFQTGIFDTELCQRASYVDAMKSGVSVMQFDPAGEAAREVEQFCDEIIKGLEKPEIGDAVEIRPISSLYQEESDNMTCHDSQTL
ncbi:MAG: ParA family partition ATPase [Desulfobacteraceae bacterium]|jgi:chromosome partitioning protein